MQPLLETLVQLREEAHQFACHNLQQADYPQENRASAANLLHYLSLRQHDLRPLQYELIEQGLTSLGILEGHTMTTLNSVIALLEKMHDIHSNATVPPSPIDVHTSQTLRQARKDALFGEGANPSNTRIMVTMPSEAATDPELVQRLLDTGMDVMRINCAHDTQQDWLAMVDHLHRACRQSGKTCTVQMDLAGPKLRTGPIAPLGKVFKLKPHRNRIGEVLQPARAWLVRAGFPSPSKDLPALEVESDQLDLIQKGDWLTLKDARNAKRHWLTVAVDSNAILIECGKTSYVPEGTVLRAERQHNAIAELKAVNIDDTVPPISLHTGDLLVLTRLPEPGRNASIEEGEFLTPAQIHCTLEEAFETAKPGDAVWFDDGKIGGVVERNNQREINVRITHTPPNGGKLRAEKGINFPDTALGCGAMTEKDCADLAGFGQHVDMIALSFVRSADDVRALQDHMLALGLQDKGVVIKIENREGFDNLPDILLAALQWPKCGVMVARGDLAVEVGFRRLSEIQEEILWLCEAAHMPVIWATQVLETLVKSGAPSRAEVTDAASSIRAECAMLNKGPNLVEGVAFLADILKHMENHYHKRRLMMRPLQVCMSNGIQA